MQSEADGRENEIKEANENRRVKSRDGAEAEIKERVKRSKTLALQIQRTFSNVFLSPLFFKKKKILSLAQSTSCPYSSEVIWLAALGSYF